MLFRRVITNVNFNAATALLAADGVDDATRAAKNDDCDNDDDDVERQWLGVNDFVHVAHIRCGKVRIPLDKEVFYLSGTSYRMVCSTWAPVTFFFLEARSECAQTFASFFIQRNKFLLGHA